MSAPARPSPARVRRLAEELAESGFALDVDDPWGALLLEDIDYALRPKVHERRVSSYGSIVDPADDRWRLFPTTKLHALAAVSAALS